MECSASFDRPAAVSKPSKRHQLSANSCVIILLLLCDGLPCEQSDLCGWRSSRGGVRELWEHHHFWLVAQGLGAHW